ncbi:uncharacterized protein LOC117321218 [Pecten maximus]|uniref:uncharacterized protein LOC117321218 n=1 Tax=Pecten maximus TaxID=6579 RepID=UPI0014585748|nr:uncharacterized protein LOC117321218 [Pecten maximus]
MVDFQNSAVGNNDGYMYSQASQQFNNLFDDAGVSNPMPVSSTPMPEYGGMVYDNSGANVQTGIQGGQMMSEPTRFRKSIIPQPYDGSSDFMQYLLQFERVVSWNRWTEWEATQQLLMVLRGPAQSVLGDISLQQSRDYCQLRNFLKERFAPSGREVAYKCQFKSRVRHEGEFLEKYSYELRRLAKLAFPLLSSRGREASQVDQFVAGLSNFDLQKHVQFQHPISLEAAVTAAIEFEAFEKEQGVVRKPRIYPMTSESEQSAAVGSNTKDIATLLLEGFDKLGKQLAVS